MILLAQRPGTAVFLVGDDAACGGGAGKRIDLATGAVTHVDVVRARAHGGWMAPAATPEQVVALDRLSGYGVPITVEEAAAMVTATRSRYLYPGPACVADDGTLSDSGLYNEDV